MHSSATVSKGSLSPRQAKINAMSATLSSSYANPRWSNAKIVGAVFVVLLHLAFLWALQNGTAQKAIATVKKVVEAKIIEEVKPKVEPPTPPPMVAKPPPPKEKVVTPPPVPKPPPPDVKSPPPLAPPPVLTAPAANPAPAPIAAPQAVVPPAAVVTPPPPPVTPPVGPAAPVKPAVRTAATTVAGSCDKPDYPSISRRAGEEGTTGLSLVISEEGKVIQSRVSSSSGYPRLDETARAALSKCTFKPATADGKAVQGSTSISYVWSLD
jgi:periplasmic protein TonB